MQITAFDQSKAQWDLHRAFYRRTVHVASRARGNIIVTTFDTGEAMVAAYSPGTTLRGRYAAHQFTLFTGRDPVTIAEMHLPSGERVPQAWLRPSGLFLHDHDTNHIVSMARCTAYDTWDGGLIPPRLRGVGQVYFMGDRAAPQPSRAITITRVVVPTPAEREHVTTLQHAARLWCTLVTDDTWRNCHNEITRGPHANTRCSRTPTPIADLLTCTTLADLTPADRLRVASFGITYTTQAITTPYLIATPTRSLT